MKYYGITDRGLARKSNQDSYMVSANHAHDLFLMVCDGIGGARGGDVASRTAVRHISEAFSQTDAFTDEGDLKRWLKTEINAVNRTILEMGTKDERLNGMGTTLAAVILTGCGRFVVNIGDSRVYGYRFENTEFRQLTTDHTLVEDLIRHGELTREEAADYPRKNVLTNALGVWDNIRYDVVLHNEPLDGFLICSDGLHGYVAHEILKSIVFDRDSDPSLRARRLVKQALLAGGYDHISVILLDLEGEML